MPFSTTFRTVGTLPASAKAGASFMSLTVTATGWVWEAPDGSVAFTRRM